MVSTKKLALCSAMCCLRDSRVLVSVITLIFVLEQCAQLAVTPLGETMDFYAHLAYVVFFSVEGRAPTPTEQSLPAWVSNLHKALATPDQSLTGEHYRAWASLSPREQRQRSADILGAPRQPDYVYTNYESQQPPLYYWVMSGVYRGLNASMALDQLAYALGLVSVCLAATALPAIYLTLRLYVEKEAALLGLLALAWFPNLLVFLGRISNDVLAFPLITWALYFCVSGRQRQPVIRFGAAGLLLGLAVFTKTYALTLYPVYIACALWGENRREWGLATLASAMTLVGAGTLFAFNYVTTGHMILLTEMRATDALPLSSWVMSLRQFDVVWFVGGLVKMFWWSGDWSFVTPGLFYYLPPAFLIVLLKAPTTKDKNTRFFSVRRLWPQYLALAGFVAGMLWHALTFTLYAVQTGQTVHAGNEGWYANVLIGSVLAAILLLLRERLSPPIFRSALVCGVVFFILWNLVARSALAIYWAGLAGVEGQLRAVRWNDLLVALHTGQLTLAGWLSLPGVVGPTWLTFGLPLLIAVLGSGAILVAVSQQPTRAHGLQSARADRNPRVLDHF